MKIVLSPVAGNKTTTVSVEGLVLTIDGTNYDISVVPEGGRADATPDGPFIGTLTREQVTVRYEYDMELAEGRQSHDWADYTFDITAGEVPCPIQWKPIHNEEV